MTIWSIAAEAGRDYITPEDVTEAIEDGATGAAVFVEVLQAIESKSAEDASLCAFIALTKFGHDVRRVSP